MGKRSRRVVSASAPLVEGAAIPQVGPREPCPCGSGKRYKQCHGLARAKAATEFVARPFEGLSGEADLVAMREIVPAATASSRTLDGVDVTLCTVLPMGLGAIHRSDGGVLVGLQVQGGSGDPSRDAAAALQRALAEEPGTPIAPITATADTPRLQDVLVRSAPLTVTMHDSYTFWVDAGAAKTEDIEPEAMQNADAAIIPTIRLHSVDAAYWCVISGRTHLRWVLSGEEEATLDGIARLHARGESGLGDGTRYLGAFRSCGLLVPVWDLAPGTTAEQTQAPAKAFADRLAVAVADPSPLNAEERRARAGITSRQLTLR